jgi:hypothetical protein
MLVIKPASFKMGKLQMDKLYHKKDFGDFVAYLKEMAIIHDEYRLVVDQMKTGDSGTQITGKTAKLAAEVLDRSLD